MVRCSGGLGSGSRWRVTEPGLACTGPIDDGAWQRLERVDTRRRLERVTTMLCHRHVRRCRNVRRGAPGTSDRSGFGGSVTAVDRLHQLAALATGGEAIEVAQRTAKVIRAWADQIDPAPEDDADQKAYDRRRVFLNPLGHGWDLRGYLPGVEGANLAAVLNEIMESERRASCSCHLRSCTCPDDGRTPAQRRADALLTLAATATSEDGALRTPPSILRTRAILIVRATDLDPGSAPSGATAPGETRTPRPLPTLIGPTAVRPR